MPTKTRRPTDLTLRNLRAVKKRLEKLEARVKKIELAQRRR